MDTIGWPEHKEALLQLVTSSRKRMCNVVHLSGVCFSHLAYTQTDSPVAAHSDILIIETKTRMINFSFNEMKTKTTIILKTVTRKTKTISERKNNKN